MEIGLTASAASVVAGLAPAVKALVGKFLRQDVPAYVRTHEPVRLEALDGEYWVVRPKGGGDQPIFVVTKQPGDDASSERLVVLSAVVPGEERIDVQAPPPDPADVALGVQILGAVKEVS